MTTAAQAYPLAWPAGWKRCTKRTEAKFRDGNGKWTGSEAERRYVAPGRVSLSEGLARVRRELNLLGVPPHAVVVSSDLKLRQDGQPFASQPHSRMDPGVAVYWAHGKAQRCMAIDIYDRLPDNLAAIAATLEAMRAIERHGGAMILDRAFTAFVALPAPEQWFQVLGIPSSSTKAEILLAYRRLVSENHPDNQGAGDQINRLQQARDDGLAQARA